MLYRLLNKISRKIHPKPRRNKKKRNIRILQVSPCLVLWKNLVDLFLTNGLKKIKILIDEKTFLTYLAFLFFKIRKIQILIK